MEGQRGCCTFAPWRNVFKFHTDSLNGNGYFFKCNLEHCARDSSKEPFVHIGNLHALEFQKSDHNHDFLAYRRGSSGRSGERFSLDTCRGLCRDCSRGKRCTNSGSTSVTSAVTVHHATLAHSTTQARPSAVQICLVFVLHSIKAGAGRR